MQLSAFFALLALFVVSAQSQDEKTFDLTNKDQFSFFFKEQWETMFNRPAPIAMAAKAQIMSVMATPLYYAPCYKMARKEGNHFFEKRLWGMHHAITTAHVVSSTVLPVDLSTNKAEGLLKMEFVQNMTYVSYTNKFDEMSMHIKAKKEEPAKPFRIYSIEDSCTLN